MISVFLCNLILLFSTFYPRNHKTDPNLFKAPQFSWHGHNNNEKDQNVVEPTVHPFGKKIIQRDFLCPINSGMQLLHVHFLIFAQYMRNMAAD